MLAACLSFKHSTVSVGSKTHTHTSGVTPTTLHTHHPPSTDWSSTPLHRCGHWPYCGAHTISSFLCTTPLIRSHAISRWPAFGKVDPLDLLWFLAFGWWPPCSTENCVSATFQSRFSFILEILAAYQRLELFKSLLRGNLFEQPFLYFFLATTFCGRMETMIWSNIQLRLLLK